MNDLLKKKIQELKEAEDEMIEIGKKFHFFNENNEFIAFDDILAENPSDIGKLLYKKVLQETDMADRHQFAIAIDRYCRLKSEVERFKDK